MTSLDDTTPPTTTEPLLKEEEVEEEEIMSNTSKFYVIPKVHMDRTIKKEVHEFKQGMRITPKAVRMIHVDAEAFVAEVFSFCKDVQKIHNTKTLNKAIFQVVKKWKFKDVHFQRAKHASD